MVKFPKSSDLKLIFKYSIKDLSRNYFKIKSIVLTLFISLFILSVILTIEDSLKKELRDNARELLGGDLELDYNRFQGDLNLINKVKDFAIVSEMVEFSTMISTTRNEKNKTLFVRVKTVDNKYPLYGDVSHEPKGALSRIHKEKNTILVNENIFNSLNLNLNEKIKIQDQIFTVIGIIKSVPDVSGFVAFGDFAIAGKQTLNLLKLNNLGSFLNYEYKVKFKQNDNIKTTRDNIIKIFKKDDKVQIRYPENSASGLKRVINNFSQFLSLVSISAMLIAGIGISNTLLSFVNKNNMSIAVKKALGFSSRIIKSIYYVQLFILLIVVCICAYVSSFFLVPIVGFYLSENLGLNIEPIFSFLNFTKIFLVGLLVLAIFSIPTINAIEQVKASSLFRNVFQSLKFKYTKKSSAISLIFLSILISIFIFGSDKPIISLAYFGAFFICLSIFFLLSKVIILFLNKFKNHPNISFKVSIKNITQSKGITPITIMSLGLGVTLLFTLALVGENFKREVSKSIPEIAPDFFFIGIQNNEREIFLRKINQMDNNANVEVVPIVSHALEKINGIDPKTYIPPQNNSYWVIESERRSSWAEEIPVDNPLTEGVWWDLTQPDKLQISLDAQVARDFNVKLGDIFTLNIYGKKIEGEVKNFRAVDYRDLSINFAMLFNPQFASNIPHEYLATAKFSNQNKFEETKLLKALPSLSIIKIKDYLSKVTNVLNKVFVAVILISSITIIIGLIVISSAVIVQGKTKEFQNLIFKILGFSRKEVIISVIIEFLLVFSSIILIAIIFAIIGSYYVIEDIFNLTWGLNLKLIINIGLGIGVITLILIMFTNYKYLSPKVYPLIRNQ